MQGKSIDWFLYDSNISFKWFHNYNKPLDYENGTKSPESTGFLKYVWPFFSIMHERVG